MPEPALLPWKDVLHDRSSSSSSEDPKALRKQLRRWQWEDTATRAPCQGCTHPCPECPCSSGSRDSQISLFQQREGRAAHAGGLGTAMCRLSCLPQLFRFLPPTSWTSGPGLVPSLAAVSPGDEGTGRTCQAPAQTGLCSSSLQPGITGGSSRGTTAGHGPPDRARLCLQPLPLTWAGVGGTGAGATIQHQWLTGNFRLRALPQPGAMR
ncbi:uncharacterized protein LOC131588207 [Poecile atricapillus]|uniref:uncharacterized protein LOC131588207 n=1 Tax=Poecile atricapillus TaxID=48891 RepID=UPI0027392552|nr:uncharacterized protein LOC131588207 [Poecile atricapillus]